MVLTARLARFAFVCPRPLVVVAPGATAERLAVERALRLRGGTAAVSAADADTLIVCGAPSTSLSGVVARLWEQIPAPRATVKVLDPDDADQALDEAVAALVDVEAQRRAAEHHTADSDVRSSMSSQDEEGDEQGAGHSHEGDGEEMRPAGLAMAEQAPDRDGLKLDQLHVQLGPVLPDWPAGLILRLAVQGDVIQEAELDTIPAAPGAHAPPSFWDAPTAAAARGEPVDDEAVGRRTAAAHLDSVGRLLGVAGWEEAAGQARRLRDDVLAGERAPGAVKRFGDRVRRSRTLRWSLDNLGVLNHHEALEHGIEGPALRAGGDVTARLRQWLAEAESSLARDIVPGEGPRGPVDGVPTRALLDVLPGLVRGLDLATARLVVASLDPDLDQLVGVPTETGHG
jgi:hypothetical protein